MIDKLRGKIYDFRASQDLTFQTISSQRSITFCTLHFYVSPYNTTFQMVTFNSVGLSFRQIFTQKGGESFIDFEFCLLILQILP